MQGGYDGTHFLSNVEVYNPVDAVWEDGVPLTSGRSGLASAVIYQPSCPQTYSQDTLAVHHSANREYDDDNSGKSTDFQASSSSSSGGGTAGHSSINFSYSSKMNQRGSGGETSNTICEKLNCDETAGGSEIKECEKSSSDRERLSLMLTRWHLKFKCKQRSGESRKDKLNHPSNHEHQSKYSSLVKKHKVNPKECPIQRLTQKIHHFMSNRRKYCDYQRRLNESGE